MKNGILDHPPEKIISRPTVIKDVILDHLFENAVSRAIPMNEYLQQFNESSEKTFIPLFKEFEKKGWVRCNGNFWWLGSWYSGEFLDMSHPLTQFSCQMLQPGVDYIQEQRNNRRLAEEKIALQSKKNIKPTAKVKYTSPTPKAQQPIVIETIHTQYISYPKVSWYEHWLFWLIGVLVLMGSMIWLVESKGQ